jgi:hypothetical protein
VNVPPQTTEPGFPFSFGRNVRISFVSKSYSAIQNNLHLPFLCFVRSIDHFYNTDGFKSFGCKKQIYFDDLNHSIAI